MVVKIKTTSESWFTCLFPLLDTSQGVFKSLLIAKEIVFVFISLKLDGASGAFSLLGTTYENSHTLVRLSYTVLMQDVR